MLYPGGDDMHHNGIIPGGMASHVSAYRSGHPSFWGGGSALAPNSVCIGGTGVSQRLFAVAKRRGDSYLYPSSM